MQVKIYEFFTSSQTNKRSLCVFRCCDLLSQRAFATCANVLIPRNDDENLAIMIFQPFDILMLSIAINDMNIKINDVGDELFFFNHYCVRMKGTFEQSSHTNEKAARTLDLIRQILLCALMTVKRKWKSATKLHSPRLDSVVVFACAASVLDTVLWEFCDNYCITIGQLISQTLHLNLVLSR